MSGRVTHLAVRALDKAAKLTLRPPEQPPHLVTGRRGEEEAYFYLRRMGYVIVARNYRSRRRPSEIDLVGWDGEVLCFIEVKTRTTREVKPAEAAVDVEKQRDLRGMAHEYMRRVSGSPAHRFDILSIYILDGADPEFTLFKNAFPVS
ncbi:MAG TPA: YraN family protein [Terriglobales bacterium]|nr:YraN family protein [Terriglobales bacterium]